MQPQQDDCVEFVKPVRPFPMRDLVDPDHTGFTNRETVLAKYGQASFAINRMGHNSITSEPCYYLVGHLKNNLPIRVFRLRGVTTAYFVAGPSNTGKLRGIIPKLKCIGNQFNLKEIAKLIARIKEEPRATQYASVDAAARDLWAIMCEVAVDYDPYDKDVGQTRGNSGRKKTTDTDMFRVLDKKPEGLPKQAVQILELMKTNGKAMYIVDIIKAMQGVVKSKQPLERIFKYYKKQLVDGEWMEHVQR